MRRLFGTAGIRGRYLEAVGPDLAFKVGAALTTFLNASKIAVGGDGRLTTPILRLAASVGIMAAGGRVVDAGLVPLPVLAWSVRAQACDGGLYVTASHNPPTDNGIKVFDHSGMEFTEGMEEGVEELINSSSWRMADWDMVGYRESVSTAIPEYVEELVERLRPEGRKGRPKVLVDAANGAASLVTPKVLTSLGADVMTLNANVDGRFPGRIPEPRPDVLEPYLPAAKALGVHAFLAHDGDGDRLAVLNPKRGFVKQDRVIALIAKHKLAEESGTVVVSVDVGRAVRDVVFGMGGRLEVVKLGKTHEGLLRFGNVVMAAEPWKLIDPSWGRWVDGIYQAALITKLMVEEGRDIDALMSEIPDYPQARFSIKVPAEMKGEVFKAVKALLNSMVRPDSEVSEIDGFRVDFGDGSWALVRMSGTEPKVRVYAEASSVDALRSLVDELIHAGIKLLKSKGFANAEVEGKIIP